MASAGDQKVGQSDGTARQRVRCVIPDDIHGESAVFVDDQDFPFFGKRFLRNVRGGTPNSFLKARKK